MEKENFIVWLKKQKVQLIIVLIIWIIAIVFLIAPISYTIADLRVNAKEIGDAFMSFPQNIASLNTFLKIFSVKGGAVELLKGTLIFSAFYFVCVLIGFIKAKQKGNYAGIEHGSSDWCTGGEQYRILSKDSGLRLSEHNYLPVDKPGNVNVLVVGGSGSGKSSSYTIPNAHGLLGSYIFTDPKGELYDTTAGFFKQNGYDVKIFNLVNPNSSDSYNPIAHVNSELDVDVIAHTIVAGQSSEGNNSDPYWDNMAELLLKSLIYYLIAARDPEEQNLASCAELVRAANNNNGTNIVEELLKDFPENHPARTNFKSVSLASDKTYQSILSTLQSKLGKFDSEDIANLTSTNTINFEEIASKKTVLYVIASDTNTAYNFLLTIFFSQMIQHMYDFADRQGGKLPIPTYFILDEFANIGQIPDFDKKISTSRSRGISFSVILQNLDQLKNIYEKSYETIIGNCDTHVFLGSNSFATVEYFSKELGEKTISHDSKSVSRDKDSKRTGYSESDQIMARALMTPDELRRMPNEECIIFEKGLKPIKDRKHFWFNDKKESEDFNSTRISHNDYVLPNRGNWRKWSVSNAFNNNIESLDEKDNSKNDNLNIEDLFDDNNQNTNENKSITPNNMDQWKVKHTNNISSNNKNISEKAVSFSGESGNKSYENLVSNINKTKEKDNKENNNIDDEVDIDVTKEIEAKFDEIFGKMTDDDE